MSLAVWPTTLPKPHREDYSLASGETRRWAGEEAGVPRVGRKFSQAADRHSMSITVTRNGRAVFDKFYTETLKNGALPFLMPDAGTDGWPLLDDSGAPITDETGTPILLTETWLCLFAQELPDRRPVGVEWRISFGLLVLP